MIADVITGVLLALGCFVALTAAIGIHRMPDFFSRMHPAGKSDTLAQALILLALIVQAGFTHPSLKLALISLFLLVTCPSSTHAIAQAASREGKEPWRPKSGSGHASSGSAADDARPTEAP